MKGFSVFLALALVAAILVACASTAEQPTESVTPQADNTIPSGVDEDKIVDGVITDISFRDVFLEKTTASWIDTCVLYEVNIRQYTDEGTFKAFESHLDRLKAMGVNTLWLMPIHPISEEGRKGTLGSYYAVQDYRAVNPEFGTMEDFRHLLNKAHEMGFKVILDWVANHTGRDHQWITDHEDWYVHTDSGEIDSPYDWTDTARLDYDHQGMRAEMIRCMQYWVEEIGVDGFRCDHAIGVPAGFWNAAVYRLKSINPEIMMLAESSAAPSLTNYAFDSCYNDALYGQALMIQGGVGTSSIKEGIAVGDKYVERSFPMNYLDNHDKNSYEYSAPERFGDTYETLLALTYIAPGMPLIYTSDEMCYDHDIAFFEKDTVKWEAEPRYAPLITALSQLKEENPALAATNRELTFYDADNSNAFAFSRTLDGNTVIYVSNLYYEELKATIDFDFDTATCVLHHDGTALDAEPVEMTAADFKTRSYNPYEFFILVLNTNA